MSQSQDLWTQRRNRPEDAPPLFILIYRHAAVPPLLHRPQGGAGRGMEPRRQRRVDRPTRGRIQGVVAAQDRGVVEEDPALRHIDDHLLQEPAEDHANHHVRAGVAQRREHIVDRIDIVGLLASVEEDRQLVEVGIVEHFDALTIEAFQWGKFQMRVGAHDVGHLRASEVFCRLRGYEGIGGDDPTSGGVIDVNDDLDEQVREWRQGVLGVEPSRSLKSIVIDPRRGDDRDDLLSRSGDLPVDNDAPDSSCV